MIVEIDFLNPAENWTLDWCKSYEYIQERIC